MRKYFLYALGEVVLIVIGILIALNINNWNEKQKIKKVSSVYLNSLHMEFRSNLKLLERSILEAQNLSAGIDNMRVFFEPQVLDTLSTEAIGMALNQLTSKPVYRPGNGVLVEIISSGNLKSLENEKLKQNLAGFEKKVELLQVQEEEVASLRNELSIYIRKEANLETLIYPGQQNYNDDINKTLFKSMYFLNTLIFYQLVQKSTIDSYYLPLKKEIEEIVDLIEKEMND